MSEDTNVFDPFGRKRQTASVVAWCIMAIMAASAVFFYFRYQELEKKKLDCFGATGEAREYCMKIREQRLFYLF